MAAGDGFDEGDLCDICKKVERKFIASSGSASLVNSYIELKKYSVSDSQEKYVQARVLFARLAEALGVYLRKDFVDMEAVSYWVQVYVGKKGGDSNDAACILDMVFDEAGMSKV